MAECVYRLGAVVFDGLTVLGDLDELLGQLEPLLVW